MDVSRKTSRHINIFFLVALVGTSGFCPQVAAAPQAAIAMHGEPALKDGFAQFPYVNPDAPDGGRLTLSVLGSFDSLNPLIVKGVPAAGIREFAIESLMARGLNEPFTLYGLLAQTIDVSDDNKRVTFALNPKARFHDGMPVTADDVLHSFELLKTKGRPNHRTYFKKVVKAEKSGTLEVSFTFEDGKDRELPMILGLMPVFAKHATPADKFESASLQALMGSGPYKIGRIDPGRSLTYVRDPSYWGNDLPVSKGRFNFDEIRYEYFRDGSAMLEAFKRGLIDIRPEEDPIKWAEGYEVPAQGGRHIVKKEFSIGLPAGMTALVFNTRRPVFSDRRVRHALMTLFDFEWINRTLYNGLYKRTESFFERSYLSSAGIPADERERELLAPFPDAVRPDIMDGSARLPVSNGSGQNRSAQRKAFQILKDAGFKLSGNRLVHTQTGQQLRFEILAHNSVQEALLLSYARSLAPLGIKAIVRVVDSAQYQERISSYDYDMIQTAWPSSLSPGNEQLFRWSAATADSKGSFNFAGVKSPAVDAMIKAMLAARSKEDFVSAVRALDRVLRSGDYVIPLFHVPSQWLAYWSHLAHPERQSLFGYAIDTWWVKQ